MYICKDCGKEFHKQVEYCDCGNNTFDFIEEVKKVAEKQTLSLEQKSNIVSIVFFAICLILSIIVWCIPVKKPAPKPQKQEVQKTVTNIPNIDKFWDDTPIYQPKPVQPAEVRTEPIPLTPTPIDYARR